MFLILAFWKDLLNIIRITRNSIILVIFIIISYCKLWVGDMEKQSSTTVYVSNTYVCLYWNIHIYCFWKID